MRRVAVAGDEIRLRPQRVDPLAIDVGSIVAEEVGRAEERVALQNVAVEIRQRLDALDGSIRLRHDGQPQTQFAKAHRFRLQIDAVERALHDAAAKVRLRFDLERDRETLDDAKRREKERARAAGRVENGDRFEASRERASVARAAHRFAADDGIQDVLRGGVAVAQPGHDGARGQDVDDGARRVEAAGRQPLLVRHQRLEDFAEHLRIDVRAGGI